MRAPPAPVTFGSTPPPRSMQPASGYSNGMSYPTASMGPGIDLVNPASSAMNGSANVTNYSPFGAVPPVAKKEGPRGIGFDDPDEILPQANLDRSSRTMPHDFIAPGLPTRSTSVSPTGVDYSEMKNELLDQQTNRIRGTMVKEDEIDNQDNISDIFFHTVFGNEIGVQRAVEEYGASVNVYDDHGFMPIHYACRRPAIKIVRYLVQAGANVNCLAQNERRDSPLSAAAQGGDLEIIHFLIENGAEIDYKNGFHVSPLHIAIKDSKKIVAIYLIHNGADIELTDSEGHTSLHWAAYKGEKRVMETLIRANAKILAVDNNGMVPLHWAAVHGHLECIKILIKADPSALNLQTNLGFTPVQMAKKYSQPEAEELLASYQNTSDRKSKSYSVKDFVSDVFAPAARAFLLPMFYVPALLYIGAYWSWPNSLYGIVGLGISFWLILAMFCKEQNSAMMGTGMWSHFYTNLLYFYYLLPRTYAELWYFHIPFFLLNVIIYEWFRQLAFEDPGYIEPSRTDMLRMVEDMKNGASLDRYCPTCWIHKPYRSKHCKHCNRCVIKMDHHCPFTGNCVGANNLKLFYISHGCYVIAELGWMYLCFHFGAIMGYADASISYWEMLWVLMENEPFLWATTMWHLFHMCWMFPLWFQQTYQVTHNVTTNEIWNAKRYDYMKDPNSGVFKNPYDHGTIENLKELFYATPKEILAKTSEFPTQQAPIDQISYLPTRTRLDSDSREKFL